MDTLSKRNRAYDFLKDCVEASPKDKGIELLDAIFNILSADAFVDMAEVEFGWEDEEDIEEEEEEEEEDAEDEDSWGTCCHDTSRIHCSICSVVGSDITHLVNTIGVVVCGSMNAEDTTADINFVTCEDCITAHEAAAKEPLKHWSNTDGLPACGEGGHSSACTAYPAAVSCPECFELMEAASEDPPGGLDPSTPDSWDNSTGKE